MFNYIKKLFCLNAPLIEEHKPRLTYKAPSTHYGKDDPEWIQKIEFIYKEVKECFLGSLQASDSLREKIKLVLTFAFAVMPFAAAKALSLYHHADKLNLGSIDTKILFFLLGVIFAYGIISIILALYGVMPYCQAGSGNEPKNLLLQNMLEQEYSLFLIGITASYQYRITLNNQANIKLGKVLSRSIIGLIMMPIILAFLIFLL